MYAAAADRSPASHASRSDTLPSPSLREAGLFQAPTATARRASPRPDLARRWRAVASHALVSQAVDANRMFNAERNRTQGSLAIELLQAALNDGDANSGKAALRTLAAPDIQLPESARDLMVKCSRSPERELSRAGLFGLGVLDAARDDHVEARNNFSGALHEYEPSGDREVIASGKLRIALADKHMHDVLDVPFSHVAKALKKSVSDLDQVARTSHDSRIMAKAKFAAGNDLYNLGEEDKKNYRKADRYYAAAEKLWSKNKYLVNACKNYRKDALAEYALQDASEKAWEDPHPLTDHEYHISKFEDVIQNAQKAVCRDATEAKARDLIAVAGGARERHELNSFVKDFDGCRQQAADVTADDMNRLLAKSQRQGVKDSREGRSFTADMMGLVSDVTVGRQNSAPVLMSGELLQETASSLMPHIPEMSGELAQDPDESRKIRRFTQLSTSVKHARPDHPESETAVAIKSMLPHQPHVYGTSMGQVGLGNVHTRIGSLQKKQNDGLVDDSVTLALIDVYGRSPYSVTTANDLPRFLRSDAERMDEGPQKSSALRTVRDIESRIGHPEWWKEPRQWQMSGEAPPAS